jgi:hypothetical protein
MPARLTFALCGRRLGEGGFLFRILGCDCTHTNYQHFVWVGYRQLYAVSSARRVHAGSVCISDSILTGSDAAMPERFNPFQGRYVFQTQPPQYRAHAPLLFQSLSGSVCLSDLLALSAKSYPLASFQSLSGSVCLSDLLLQQTLVILFMFQSLSGSVCLSDLREAI